MERTGEEGEACGDGAEGRHTSRHSEDFDSRGVLNRQAHSTQREFHFASRRPAGCTAPRRSTTAMRPQNERAPCLGINPATFPSLQVTRLQPGLDRDGAAGTVLGKPSVMLMKAAQLPQPSQPPHLLHQADSGTACDEQEQLQVTSEYEYRNINTARPGRGLGSPSFGEPQRCRGCAAGARPRCPRPCSDNSSLPASCGRRSPDVIWPLHRCLLALLCRNPTSDGSSAALIAAACAAGRTPGREQQRQQRCS